MKRRRIALIISLAVFVVAILSMGAVVFNLSGTAEELARESTKTRADAILSSANVNDKTSVSVPILYYDQKMDACTDMYGTSARATAKNRQFEWSECGYQNFALEKEIVEGELNEEYLPVIYGGEALVNRGINNDTFKRWFSAVDGSSKNYAGIINLTYISDKSMFVYDNDEFYPLDSFTMHSDSGEWVPKNEKVNNDGHNHLFTLSLGIPIQTLANGSERFEITADDDTWVFVDNRLVIDMGGIHDSENAIFEIRNTGEVYASVANEGFSYTGVTLIEKDSAVIRIFHADRDSGTGSAFSIKLINMVPNITNTEVARKDGGGDVEVAYDPANPSYVAPLGESLTVKPNMTKALVSSLVVQGVIMCVLAVVVVIAAMVGIKNYRQSEETKEQQAQIDNQKLQQQ